MAELEPQFMEVVDTSALELRHALTPDNQEGVVGAGDLKVSAGAGMTVDVAAGIGFVQGDAVADQGLYRIRNDATKNSAAFDLGGITPAHATLPRIDQIICRVYDQTHDGLGLRKWRLEVLTGTATSGATLDNRTGATALPNSAFRIADILIPAAAVSVIAGNVRDRRPWSRGFYNRILKPGAANLATSSTTYADADATNLKPRVECSGNPVRIKLSAETIHSVSQGLYAIAPAIDGVVVDSATASGDPFILTGNAAAGGAAPSSPLEWTAVPTAGSHLIGPQFKSITAGTTTIFNPANVPLILVIEEILRQNANNT